MSESNESREQTGTTPDQAAKSFLGVRSWRRLLVRVLLAGAGGVLALVLVLLGLILYYGRDLPSFERVEDYRPPQVTRVYDRNGQLVAEFFHERRTVVARDRIPKVLKQAVVAAEDANFYEHAGLDYLGIARAVLKDLREMRAAQGASTITQQVVKNLVLSPERSVARKVKEAILARRLEQNLSKEDILWLYLNHIYYGHLRYGVEEASQFFFGKSVDKVTLGEAALLAGLPQSPGKLSPLRQPERAKARQTYVLNQMVETHAITRAQADAEIAKPIVLARESFEAVGPYYAEEVRRQLLDRYGEQTLYEGGLRIDVAMDRTLQAAADASLRRGLELLEQRFGYRPPTVALDQAQLAAVRALAFDPERAAMPSRDPSRRPEVLWDFAAVSKETVAEPAKLAEAVDLRPLVPGAIAVVPVVEVRDEAVRFDLGGRQSVLPFEQFRWARPYAPGKYTPSPRRSSDVFAVGQLARVRILEVPPAPRVLAGPPAALPPAVVELAPVPQVQGALVSIDPASRYVVALAGGYDFATSAFNRATQARRQPGSSFKPFVYAAALASGKFTTASILNDAPDLFRDPWTGKEWKPQNFEKDVFEGPMTLREALSKSKNTISVRLIEAVGPQAVIDLARRSGIESAMPENMTLALGTAEVSPLELANGYTTLATLGQRAEPILIVRVRDAAGKVLEEHHAVPEETIPPPVAAITTSLMRSVVEIGTGAQAGELRRPVAGKTGTASGNRDAWFSGFTPELVATAWTGFDDHSSLGPTVTGGMAALPIWLEYMKAAMAERPALEFPVPAGLEQVRIDPHTGLRAQDGAPGRMELFVEGTAPKDFAVRPGEANPEMLFLEDGGRQWR